MSRRPASFALLLAGLVLLGAGPVAADDGAGMVTESEPASAEGATGEQPETTERLDPLTAHLQSEVARYYRGIGTEPTDDELDRGLQTLSFMLLDGVSLARIEAAIDAAVRLHSPGRRVPFEVAVPLRVQPAASPGPAGDSRRPSQDAPQSSATSPSAGVSDEQEVDPAAREQRAERRKKTEMKRNRLRLYKQWKSRTKGKRALLSVGIPLLATGYALGFGVAGSLTLLTNLPQSWAWVTSVPVVGTLLLGIWTEGLYPGFFTLSVMQIAGAAFLVGGILVKANWPYKKDPTALHIGTKRGGGPAVTLRAGMAGTSGWITGRF